VSGKVQPAAGAVAAFVPEGSTLAVGGMHLQNNPMAMVLELVRQDRHIARLITSPSAAMNADVLIGAGLVREVATSYIGFEHLGLAPCFRRAAESGAIRVVDLDEASIMHGLSAGASGMPFAPLPRGLELAEVWRANSESYRVIDDPFGSGAVLTVRAICPDVAVIHAAEADESGTAWLAGAPFTDRLMALAARHVIVQVERVVSSSTMSARSIGSTIPGFLIDAVVEAPGGCWPTASHGGYPCDEEAVKEYLRMARTEEGFTEWLTQRVPAPAGVAGS
jgi:glutaconate CoA-transferase, subunit A